MYKALSISRVDLVKLFVVIKGSYVLQRFVDRVSESGRTELRSRIVRPDLGEAFSREYVADVQRSRT